MHLGFVSAILPDLALEEILRFTAEAGLDCVELMCWPRGKAERRYAGVTHLDVDNFTTTEADRVRALCAKHSVTISGLGYYPNPLAPDEHEAQVAVEHLRKVIVAAKTLGINHINTFIGRDWTKSVDDNWPRFRATWPPLVQFAEEMGVAIGIENCPMYFTRNEWPGGKNLATCPAIWRRMFAEIPSKHFGLNFDPSHLVWQQMDWLKPLREFSSRLLHLHAKDVLIDRDKLNEVGILATPNEYHRPKLPGLGEIDWGRFFSTLYDVGFNGAVCIEVEDKAFEKSLETRKAAVRQSAAYLRNFLVKAG
jgi:sugar phosphate isomerase/epimerase